MSFQGNLESIEANHLALQLCNGFNQKPATKTLKVFWASHRGFTRSIVISSRAENRQMPTFIVLQCWVGLWSTFRPGFVQHFWGISLDKTKSAR